MEPELQKRHIPTSPKTLEKNQSIEMKADTSRESTLKQETVKLTQDFFGYYYSADGLCRKIKRFTWTNQNRIQVKVINYGARIVSMKFPDRKGDLEDIILGFDDLAGYIYYKKYHFGATIGRTTNVVRHSTFKIGKKDFFLKPNMKDGGHRNGGSEGFDQVVWNTYIQGKKVIMSHLSPTGDQGYPGNLLVRIYFELSERNEFKIDMEAFTSEPTIVNLSNLVYFNLAGHHAGPDGIYKHVVTINCNCFTKQDADGNCTGEILNVAHSPFDFQTPRALGKVIGIVPKDGFNQNLCVNRAVNQDDCFVARILHSPSGRFLEIYSNQYGVQFDTANNFGYGRVLSLDQLIPITTREVSKEDISDEHEDISLMIVDYLHGKMLEQLREEEETYYAGFREFVQTLQKSSYKNPPLVTTAVQLNRSSVAKRPSGAARPSKGSVGKGSMVTFEDELQNFKCTPEQINYLKTVQSVLIDECFDESADWLREVIEKLIYFATKNAEKSVVNELSPKTVIDSTSLHSNRTILSQERSDKVLTIPLDMEKPVQDKPIPEKINSEKPTLEKPSEYRVSYQIKEGDEVKLDEKDKKVVYATKIPLEIPQFPPKKNVIPPYYKSCDQIIGKGRRLYKMHGGVAFQTQNYPNCANIENFPKCVLNPGEKYKHTIVYKFWIRSGNPNKWIKRNTAEVAQISKT